MDEEQLEKQKVDNEELLDGLRMGEEASLDGQR